ncbi:putative nuclease HARBI1 [Acipenser ruthenus]|uniref:putative nuclease HARBI1 n=1 Tax=Acipenser ruthenus TaxID=7906 RepID=UPI0027423D7A|nr:putative nuclease HARBI1 [Acipenser ruthenus]
MGDSGYPLKPFLIMTPIENELTPAERRYNRAHKKCRAKQDRLYGVWKSRWRCHDVSGGYMQYRPEKVVLFIKATAVLHNMCRMATLPDPDVSILADRDHVEPFQGQLPTAGPILLVL